jgi:outer membrane protein assembly factor BamB
MRTAINRWTALLPLVALAAGLIVGVLASPAAPALAADVATIDLSRTAGPPTTQVDVKGRGFASGELVDLMFDVGRLGTAQANSSGDFVVGIGIPASALPGSHALAARGRTSQLATHAIFTVRTDWTQFGFDLYRSGYNPFEHVLGVGNAADLRLAWSTGLPVDPTSGGFVIYGSPIYFGGRVYVTFGDGLYGLDPTTGAIIINYRTGGADLGAPAAAAGLKVLDQETNALFVGAKDGSIYGFDTTDDKPNPLWKASVGVGIQTPLLLIGSRASDGACVAPGPCQLIFGAGDSLYAFDTNGNRLWAAALDGAISGAPSALGNPQFPWIFVGTQSNLLYAVNAVDGSVAWAAKLDGLPGTVAIGNPNIYVGTSAGSLYSLSAVDGSLRWQFATDGAIAGGPALGDANADGRAEVLASSADGDIYAIDTTDDKPLPLWVARLGTRISASPALANGVLYLVAEGGDISRRAFFALDSATGAVLFQTGLRSTIHSSPIVADGKVLMVADGGDIYTIVPPVPE